MLSFPNLKLYTFFHHTVYCIYILIYTILNEKLQRTRNDFVHCHTIFTREGCAIYLEQVLLWRYIHLCLSALVYTSRSVDQGNIRQSKNAPKPGVLLFLLWWKKGRGGGEKRGKEEEEEGGGRWINHMLAEWTEKCVRFGIIVGFCFLCGGCVYDYVLWLNFNTCSHCLLLLSLWLLYMYFFFMSSIVDDESVLIFFSFFLFFHLLFHHRVISVLFSIFSSVILSSCHLFLLLSFTFLLILSCHLFLLSYFSFRIILSCYLSFILSLFISSSMRQIFPIIICSFLLVYHVLPFSFVHRILCAQLFITFYFVLQAFITFSFVLQAFITFCTIGFYHVFLPTVGLSSFLSYYRHLSLSNFIAYSFRFTLYRFLSRSCHIYIFLFYNRFVVIFFLLL